MTINIPTQGVAVFLTACLIPVILFSIRSFSIRKYRKFLGLFVLLTVSSAAAVILAWLIALGAAK